MANTLPALIDPQGRPLVRSELTKDVAGPMVMGNRSILAGHPAQGLTPVRLAELLLSAEQGDAIAYLELAEEMEEKHLHYLSVLGTRKRQVAQLPIEVTAASDDKDDEADAQLVRDWLDRDTLENELFDMLDAIGKGFSVTEIIWAFDDLWLPRRLETRDPRWFEFDRDDGKTLLLKGLSQPEPLTAAKYVVHVHPAKTGIAIRGGLARAAAWAYLFQNYAVKDWVRFAEVYGLPLRVGRYENGTQEPDIRLLLRAIAQLGSDASAAFPKSMEVEFVDGKHGDKGELFQNLCVYLDQQLSKAVLGQTATTDATAGGLGDGQANTHNDVRGDIERADAKLLAATLNRDLVPWLVQLNRGPRRRYPRIRIGRPEAVDVKQAIASIEAGVKLGVPIGVHHFRKVTGTPEPKDGEELLQAPAAQPAEDDKETVDGPSGAGKPPTRLLGALKPPHGANGKATAAAASEPEREPDGIDRAIEDELGDWEQLIEPALGPVEAAIAELETWEDVRVLLSERAGEMIAAMDVAQLTEVLARAGFGAELAGRLADPGAR